MKRVNFLILVLVLLSGTFVPFLPDISAEKKDTAILSTKFGDIVIAFKDDVAPKTVANFKKLANSGFYDGTIFHRIIPGFVIQGGDPNTKSGSRDTWGMGDPGYTIVPEYSNLKHKKYIVSMARGAGINSAGSQFVIMLGDAPGLDGQFTIFGEVISGKEVVDKIASLPTNSDDQPIDEKLARMNLIIKSQDQEQEKTKSKTSTSLKMKVDGMTVIVELGNPKSNSVPVYKMSITSDVSISSGKGPSGWSMKKQTTTHTFDTIIFSTESKPIMPGKSAQFSFTSKNLTLGMWWHAYDQNGKLITEGFTYSPFLELINGLANVVRLDHSSYEAIVKEDFSSAKENTAAKRKSLSMVREEYQSVKENLGKNSRKSVEAILNYFDKTINMEERGIFLEEKKYDARNKLSKLQQAPKEDAEWLERQAAFFRDIELAGYASLAVADEYNIMISEAGKLAKDPLAKYFFTSLWGNIPNHNNQFSANVISLKKDGQLLLEWADTYHLHESIKNSEILSAGVQISKSIIPDDLARFFDTFDKDHDKKIDLTEAQAFYYWVEQNILYRYDDENEENPIRGTIVGDGRQGRDYRQTPYETYKERVGDCEDTATLEQAFYNHFGVPAYVAGVNANANSVIDHAATIVLMSVTRDDFQKVFGGLVYYDYSRGADDVYANSIQKGIYMLVDNAYSEAFGYLSNGLEKGTFSVSCIIPLEQGYGADWNRAVNKCSIPFN